MMRLFAPTLLALAFLGAGSARAQCGPAKAGPPPPAKSGQGVEGCYCTSSSGVSSGLPKGTAPAECDGLRVAYKMKEVDKRAKITARPQPGYTRVAEADRVQGVVILLAVLCPSGSVSDVSVIRSLPGGLTEQAIAAAKKLKFVPAEKGGQKVAQFQLLEYHFGP